MRSVTVWQRLTVDIALANHCRLSEESLLDYCWQIEVSHWLLLIVTAGRDSVWMNSQKLRLLLDVSGLRIADKVIISVIYWNKTSMRWTRNWYRNSICLTEVVLWRNHLCYLPDSKMEEVWETNTLHQSLTTGDLKRKVNYQKQQLRDRVAARFQCMKLNVVGSSLQIHNGRGGRVHVSEVGPPPFGSHSGY